MLSFGNLLELPYQAGPMTIVAKFLLFFFDQSKNNFIEIVKKGQREGVRGTLLRKEKGP